jgi:hypothetical protein
MHSPQCKKSLKIKVFSLPSLSNSQIKAKKEILLLQYSQIEEVVNFKHTKPQGQQAQPSIALQRLIGPPTN